ncbi:MAG: glycosyltransferase family 4 protein [Candidatus Microbacterium colombiense]|nr:MAG: glycosyltransferase family 4 protein [Microbacterium sp.]
MTDAVAASGRTVLVANPSADLYGSDRMLLEAVRAFRAAGDRVVVTCSVDGPLVPRLREAGAEVVVLASPIIRKSMLSPRGMLQLVRTTLSALPRMRRLIRDTGADVVFANTLTTPFWTLAARLSRRPGVVYVHEAEASLSPASRRLLTAPLRLATGIVFNSETSLRVCRPSARPGIDRVWVVYNGVEGPASITPPRERIDGPVRVAYVGRLSPRKGVDLVVDAIAALREQGVEAQADIVGDVFPGYEWYEAELRQRVAALELQDAIRFVGFLPSVWDAVAGADVAIVPSRADESFGNVVIEAILSARPVVVADHTGLREAAAGFESTVLVRSDDAAAFADGIRRIRDDWSGFRAQAIADAERASTRFNTERYQSEILSVMAQIAPR